jgi:hypothetical protein
VEKTARQKWTEQISQHRKKCQKILAMSRSVRFVGLINEYGRTLTGIIRPGTRTLLSDQLARNEFFLISILFSMRKKASYAFGRMDYTIFKHEKVIVIVVQRNEGTYYVSVSKNATHQAITKIITGIRKVI